ncbi:TAXI family TRAP transporter solute-binding subunit [Oceaniglobus roseus]|uniref:TAXI family TRAP transporter solute-binding subunit n=1 Tax=Oceaniglobus roseus TaxID=1737570 RepID=UPI0012FFFE8D|nr:TAXI family TRAP transporter solute-binding subunit [Kandeliimicrobium roseum]
MTLCYTSNRLLAGAVAVAGSLLATTAGAQTLGLGTTQGGATGQIGTALAQVISMNSDLQVIPQISANTSQYIPLLDQGKLELAIANYPQTWYAVTGTGMSTEKAENLRLVATLMPFLAALVAPEDSGIKSYADIKGHKVPRYSENSLGDFVIRAALAAGDLTYDDVESVPISNFPQQYEAFKDGRIDVSIATVGSQASFDLEASVGDIQFLPVPESHLEQAKEFLPGAYLQPIAANDDLPGLDEPTTVFAYDYLLFANASVPDGEISQVAGAIYEGSDFLMNSSPVWADFVKEDMGKKADIPYHPGAIAYYEEIGILN